MDILKIKEQFGKSEVLKEQIKEFDKEVMFKKQELEDKLESTMGILFKNVCDEVDAFFTSYGFKFKIDGYKRKYQYGSDEIDITIYSRKSLPLTIDIEIKTANLNKWVSLYPTEDRELFYYGKEPWNHINMNANGLYFNIYMLDMFKDVEQLELVKGEYKKTLDKIFYTKETITNLTEFSYFFENMEKHKFAEIFALI